MSIQLQTPHLFPRWHHNKPPPGTSVELSREPMALKWASYMRHNLIVVIALHVMLHKREHKDTYRAEVTFDFSPCIWNWVPWDAFSVAVVSLSLSGRWGFIINVKLAAVQWCQDTISNIVVSNVGYMLYTLGAIKLKYVSLNMLLCCATLVKLPGNNAVQRVCALTFL